MNKTSNNTGKPIITVDKDSQNSDSRKEVLISFESKCPDQLPTIKRTKFYPDSQKDLLHFYDTIEFKLSGGKEKQQIEVGVHWLRGVLSEKDYKMKVKVPLDERPEELIELDNFEGATEDDDSGVDPFYYNSVEPLRNFKDPEAVKNDVEEFISGRKTAANKKSRRRKAMTEKEKVLKKMRNEENMSCGICSERAEGKKERILLTRCDCLTLNGRTPPSIRLHKKCYWKKITRVQCSQCQKRICLPVS
jgi:hypothetical protein